MRTRAWAAVVAVAAFGAGASQASADDVLTPAGPATLRDNWLGASTAEGRPPEVLVAWSVTVGPGGNGGPVRLQVLDGATGTVAGAGPVEQLPAAPGTYTFPLPVGRGIRYDYRQAGLALAQEVGGHAVLETVPARPELGPYADPAQLHVVDVFTPQLADDAQGVGYAERRFGQRLRLAATIEPDIDADLLGDTTQDAGDLRVVDVRIAEHRANAARVVTRVLNAGATVRNVLRVEIPGQGVFCTPARPCDLVPPLAPGAVAEVTQWVDPRHGEPTRVVVSSEGPDTNPADNAADVPPFLRLEAVRRPGVRFALGATRAGSARITARVAGLRLSRSVRFAHADRRVLGLTPARQVDRRRLAAAIRRPGRLPADVTATMGATVVYLRVWL